MQKRFLALSTGLFAALGFSATAQADPMVGVDLQNGQPKTVYGENLLSPIPDGFKIDRQDRTDRSLMQEMVARSESVTDWTVMVTTLTVKGQFPATPDQFSQNIADGFRRSCPHGDGVKMTAGETNGYPYTQWQMTCDLNPMSHKPEFMIMRTYQANDAFFNVQYAFRDVPDDGRTKQAIDYLNTVQVCDTRIADRPCKLPSK
jgi:hypothetical protein